MRTPLSLLLTALLVLPAAAQAQAPAAVLGDPVPIAAHDGRLAYSERDDAGRWRLMTRVGALTGPLPIATRSVPFDVDLGPDERGRTIAVYSRCDREQRQGLGTLTPRYDDARGCDVFRFDFADGRERPVSGANSSTASEYWPTVWRTRIAFARTYDRKSDYPYLYVRPLEGRATSQRMPGGQREACFRDRRTRRVTCTPDDRSAPYALELYGRRLAFGWTYQGFAESPASEIRLDTIGGGHRRVDSFGGGGLTVIDLSWPAFEAGRLYWSRACFGDGSGCVGGRSGLRRLAYGARNAEPVAVPTPRFVHAHDRDAGLTTVLLGGCEFDPPDGTGRCELVSLRPDYDGRVG